VFKLLACLVSPVLVAVLLSLRHTIFLFLKNPTTPPTHPVAVSIMTPICTRGQHKLGCGGRERAWEDFLVVTHVTKFGIVPCVVYSSLRSSSLPPLSPRLVHALALLVELSLEDLKSIPLAKHEFHPFIKFPQAFRHGLNAYEVGGRIVGITTLQGEGYTHTCGGGVRGYSEDVDADVRTFDA